MLSSNFRAYVAPQETNTIQLYVRNFLKSNHFYDTNLHTAHHIACWNRDLGDHLDIYVWCADYSFARTLLLWTSFLFLVSEIEKTEIFSGKFVSTSTRTTPGNNQKRIGSLS
jgi:hypothetical protein